MRLAVLALKLILSLAVFSVIGITIGYFYFSSNLPKLDDLASYRPPLTTHIYNTDGELLAEYADEHRILTPFNEIPKKLRGAFLAAEDQQFYEHPGINPARIFSAALANLRAGHTVQGGSTITQQVAKNFLLSSERTYTRKIREIILSYRIEKAFSKDDILFLYLNHIYLGRGSYGVASAARRYFGKTLDQLSLSECAMLAGLPKAPGKYGPHLNLKLATKRRNTVLYLMERSGFASPEEVAKAIADPLHVAELTENRLHDAYENEIYQQLVQRFGINTLRRQGLSIIVPYQEKAENDAIRAVREGVLDVEHRQYYRTPVNHPKETWPDILKQWASQNPDSSLPGKDEILPALVEKVTRKGELQVNDGAHRWLLGAPDWHWAPEDDQATTGTPSHPRTWIAGDEIRLQGNGEGGVRLIQDPSVESALYSIDLNRGTVLARVGGFEYHFGDFDRVSQAQRQPGSAIKPLLYATALEQGQTPATIVMDTPIVFDGQSADNFWRPENYKNKFAGPVTLRNALEHSRNLAAIKLLQDIGIRTFTEKLRDFGFNRDFPPQLALALGATEVSLEKLTESYIPLASHGMRWKPVTIQQVQDRDGRTLFRSVAGHRCQTCHADPVLSVGEGMRPAIQVLDSSNSFVITNMLKGVIEHGTGRRALALHRPAAGKTGTTNKQVDAWFIGYTPQVLTGVWTGRDTPSTMGRYETGSRAALPTWLSAMQAFHQSREKEDFTAPAGIEWVMIDPSNGKLAGPATQSPYLEAFREGTAPTEVSSGDSETPQGNGDEEFFDSGL